MRGRVVLMSALGCMGILGVLAAVFYVDMPRPRVTDSGEAIIHLTAEGFEPDTLTIPRGAQVRFTSELDKAFWPASNLHPSHDIYPAFDPLRPLQPGEEWSFVFDKAGTWRFHDHLRSYYTGVIYVTE